jgi:hypothetical protein
VIFSFPSESCRSSRHARSIAGTSGEHRYLESEGYVEDCLRKHKGELMAAIQAGQKTRPQ